MSTHTPGPWALGNAANAGKNLAVCSGHAVIARVVGNGYPTGIGNSPDSDANARLIAAAPDLLEALLMLDQAANGPWDGSEQTKYMNIAHAKARAAIAKVTQG